MPGLEFPPVVPSPRDGICWQVRQLYRDTRVPGRFLLQAQGARGAVHVVVAETDYQSFAVLYLERAGQLSVKLYARSLPVSDSVLSGFEQRVREAHLTEDQIFFFPNYGECPQQIPASATPTFWADVQPDPCLGPPGFCEAADQFHVLNGECAVGQAWRRGEGGHSQGLSLISAAEVRRRRTGACGLVGGWEEPAAAQGLPIPRAGVILLCPPKFPQLLDP
ncbi:Complement component C8 gamma chain [Saguinus oedipus]|uniref:Complement component C8 gamma chain n=1 Tax=Saguinus oedipus TaxID=9490 RepID=A0ABQ9WGF2_SAGOE|nr:Complement component C8 gamma chain [Saguinus oedipus]